MSIKSEIKRKDKFFAGYSTPPKRRELHQLIRTNKTERIHQWLCSMNPEIQVYGYLGMCILERLGYPLSDETKRMMKAIKAKHARIYTCFGCSVGSGTRIYEYLNRIRLEYEIEMSLGRLPFDQLPK